MVDVFGGGGGGGFPASVSCYSNNTQGGCNVGFVNNQIRTHQVIMLQESGNPGWVHDLSPVPGLANVLEGTLNFGTGDRICLRNVVHY